MVVFVLYSVQGRFFYACNNQRSQQCKFFQWADDSRSSDSKASGKQNGMLHLTDADSIMTYFKSHGVQLYCECQLLRKAPDRYQEHRKGYPVIVITNCNSMT